MHLCLATDPSAPEMKMTKLIKFVGQKGRKSIPAEIGDDYFKFGKHLLNDDTGKVVDAIRLECQNCPEQINANILRRWTEGKGKTPVTWATLIEVLKDISHHPLAEDIECSLVEQLNE